LSSQNDTAQLPAFTTAADGVVWAVDAVHPAAELTAATGVEAVPV
jgi:hypothetical protein